MARRKSTIDLLKGEKYMDDAAFSALMNLHKAAKRKNEYVWATEKFNFLDSIWAVPVETENSNILLGATSNVGKYPENNDSETLERLCYFTDTKPNTSQQRESSQAKIKSYNSQKSEFDHEQIQKISLSQKESLLKNFNYNDEQKGNKLECSNQSSKIEMPNVEMLKLKRYSRASNFDKPCESRVKRENQNIEQKISEASHEPDQAILQKPNFIRTDPDKTGDHSKYLFRYDGQTHRVSSVGKSNYAKSKINSCDTPQKERVKRKRNMSSSVNSLPEQKHLPKENLKHGTIDRSDKRSGMLKTMVLLKIFKVCEVFDFILELLDLERIKKKFPKFQEILPEIDGGEKEIGFSAEAVKVVIGYLCNLHYTAPDERTAIEVLAASKSWEILKFHDEFSQMFLKNLNRNNIHLAYGAATYYNLREICNAYERTFSEELSNNRPYRLRKCYVSVSTYVEPREFCIQSKTATSTLDDNFNRDVTNVILFKAITGSYVITGFHILLNFDSNRYIGPTKLEFSYVVTNLQNSYKEEAKVRKPLRPIIVINFQRSLIINQDQTAEIVVETSIKPYLCSAVQKNIFFGMCDGSQFSLNMTSTYKVANSDEKRFFIGKLLYYPNT